jgi:drug/metabolite transporter (DMT)-like permease
MTLSLLCFTGNALLLRQATVAHGADAWLALLFRAVGGMGVVVLLWKRGMEVEFRRALTVPMLVSRGVVGGVSTAAYYITIGPLGPGKATLISFTWVIWAAIMAAYFLREALSPVKILGIAVAIGGLALLTGVDREAMGHLGRHELIGIGGALLAALAVIAVRQLTRTQTSATIFTSQCVYAAVIAMPFVVLRWRAPDAVGVALLCGAAAFAAVGQLSMTEGFRKLTVSEGGAFQVVTPVLITLASVAVFAEPFTLAQAGGAGLIPAGCYLTAVLGSRKKPELRAP